MLLSNTALKQKGPLARAATRCPSSIPQMDIENHFSRLALAPYLKIQAMASNLLAMASNLLSKHNVIHVSFSTALTSASLVVTSALLVVTRSYYCRTNR